MLRKEIYIGNLVQARKTSKTGSRDGDYRIKSRDEWIVVKKACEAIVSDEVFYKVQEIMDLNKKIPIFKQKYDINSEPINRYKNIIFDGNTGLSLLRISIRSNKKMQISTIINLPIKMAMVEYLKLQI